MKQNESALRMMIKYEINQQAFEQIVVHSMVRQQAKLLHMESCEEHIVIAEKLLHSENMTEGIIYFNVIFRKSS